MAKKLDLNKPVFELVQEYPELVDVLKDLGFSEITKPAMLNSVGRITTIPKGAKMRNISMMKVVPALMSNGFELIGKMPNIFALGKNNAGDETSSEDGAFQENTREKIKSYLKRLGEGEDLESVRKDFVENFSEVEASEIMKAEQELIKEGTPICFLIIFAAKRPENHIFIMIDFFVLFFWISNFIIKTVIRYVRKHKNKIIIDLLVAVSPPFWSIFQYVFQLFLRNNKNGNVQPKSFIYHGSYFI